MPHPVSSVSLSWREPFVWRRLAVGLTLSLVPCAVCLSFRAGFLALIALALGSYPWPVQVAVGDRGLSLRWLFVRETWLTEDFTRASLTTDPRRWAWPRRKVLRIERRAKRALVLFGGEATLTRLHQLAQRAIEASAAH